jgi:hypothetical protein
MKSRISLAPETPKSGYSRLRAPGDVSSLTSWSGGEGVAPVKITPLSRRLSDGDP